MKKYFLFFLFILILFEEFESTAQSTNVKQRAQNTWVEKIGFDEKAIPPSGQESSYYYLLIDEQENVSLQESFVHYAYKILTNEGLQQMSDLSFEFDPSYEQLILHTVVLHRNGTVLNQLPKEIRTLQREQSMDRFLYDGTLTAIINLSDVHVGDIIEYSFTRKGYNPIYDNYFSRRINFNFNVAFEKYFQRLIAPVTLDLSFKYINTSIEPVVEKENHNISYTWEANHVSGVLYDNHEPDWYYSNQCVYISNFKTWGEVAKWAAKRYSVNEQDKQEVANEFIQKFKGSSQEEYALAAIQFVQDEIRYLGFESGLNSHLPHPPFQVYQQRFGDCKDKSLLLSTLLTARGIESYPVLVNTVFRHKIVEQLPSTNSFNHCVVQLKLNDHTVYVDPTISSQGGELDHYYFPPYGKGLVIHSQTSNLTDLPEPMSSSISETQIFDLASIGGEGMLKIETSYTGSEADNQRSYFANNNLESIQKDYLTFYGNLYPDIQKFESIQFEDNRKVNVFKVKEKYKIPTFWRPYKNQEGKIYCEFYPQALETYFNITKSAQRIAPYRLTYPLDYSHKIYVQLPEEWNVTTDQVAIENKYYKYDFEVSYNNKNLSILTHYVTKQESIPVEDFSKFVDDHGKMMNNLSYMLSYDQTLVQKTSDKLPGIVVSILALVAGVYLIIWLYFNYNPKPHYPETSGIPIGGWLILVGLGIVISPLKNLYELLTVDNLLNGESWLAMWYNKSYGYFIFLLIEHIYNIVYLMLSIVVLILFFQRRTSVPKLISILYAVPSVVIIIDNLVAQQINPNQEWDTKGIFRAIAAAVIWIPYFSMSTRVKKTFVFMNTKEVTD